MSSEFILAYLQTCYDDLRQAGSSGGTTKGALTCGFLSQYPFPSRRSKNRSRSGTPSAVFMYESRERSA